MASVLRQSWCWSVHWLLCIGCTAYLKLQRVCSYSSRPSVTACAATAFSGSVIHNCTALKTQIVLLLQVAKLYVTMYPRQPAVTTIGRAVVAVLKETQAGVGTS
jgi:hypothetical protein